MLRPPADRCLCRRSWYSRLAAAAGLLGGLWAGIAAERSARPPEDRLIGERFLQLTRAARWQKTAEVKLAFRTYHPQGMSLYGERFFLSSVEVTDRAQGQGIGHLFEVDFEGQLRRQIRLGEGPAYHPGGIDYDGRWLWVPVAEYRPDSRSLVYRVDPETLAVKRVFEFRDHLGALVCDRQNRRLVGVSWGSRKFYRWEMLPEEDGPREPGEPATSLNGSHYVDYQDGQHLAGTSWALFGGLSRLSARDSSGFTLGGLELVDLGELRAVHQLPIPLQTKRGQSLLQNAMAVQLAPTGLRCYFLPEDEESTLYVYAVE